MPKGNLQIVFLVIFVIAAIVGLLVFSGAIKIGNNSGGTGSLGTVVVWGTERSEDISLALDNFNRVNKTINLQYVQKYPETFDQDLLEALASGTGPDLFLLSDDLAYKYSNKIYTIPFVSYSLASFRSAFASAGEVFVTSKGILAFPITVDPMVMYYNRSILDANNIIYPPTYWDELQTMAPNITKKDELNKVNKSAVAMGQFTNINNAKNIIATLFMQLGNKITEENNGSFNSTLMNGDSNFNLSSVLQFYTDFTDPLKAVYSWNRSMPNSKDFFTADDLAFYFGYASEFKSIINKNPNLNFQVAPMPQVRNAKFKLTHAKVKGIAITASTKNFNGAFTAASLMATTDFASTFANSLHLVPARRDLLSAKTVDAYFPIFYSSALLGKAWVDPSPVQTDDIFKNMVDSVLSGNLNVDQAIRDTSSKLDLLLNK